MSTNPTHITAPDGTPFIEVVRFIQTFEFEGAPGSVSLETRTLDDIGGRTRMHQNAVFPSVAARDQALAAGMEHGINDSMDRLAELLGSGAVRQGS
jgi:uncharacterized protein YndB with AHSA1/START domain